LVTAYVLVVCKTGLEFKTRQELLRVPEIVEARITFGMYDIVCKIDAPSMKSIQDIIINDIRESGLIKETQTLTLTNY
jgi:DNA-binding Lrp family transcriptional regulator